MSGQRDVHDDQRPPRCRVDGIPRALSVPAAPGDQEGCEGASDLINGLGEATNDGIVDLIARNRRSKLAYILRKTPLVGSAIRTAPSAHSRPRRSWASPGSGRGKALQTSSHATRRRPTGLRQQWRPEHRQDRRHRGDARQIQSRDESRRLEPRRPGRPDDAIGVDRQTLLPGR